MSELWLPQSHLLGSALEVKKAVQEYDPDLTLGRHVDGSWAVMVERGPEGQPFPVYNLGHELPGVDRVKRLLYEADVRRHGHKIVEQIQRRNDQRAKELNDIAHDAAADTAERIESALRNAGERPNTRIFVPSRGD